MQIIINGNKTDVTDSLTVVDLLKEQNVKMPDMVSVELNDEILKRSEFESTVLKENDSIEFLYFMGGGALRDNFKD